MFLDKEESTNPHSVCTASVCFKCSYFLLSPVCSWRENPRKEKVWQRKDENEEVLTLFLPRMTKTISNQKNMAMTTDPIGTISSTLVFSSAPRHTTEQYGLQTNSE